MVRRIKLTRQPAAWLNFDVGRSISLWHVKDGIPSVADVLLVAGGMWGVIFLLQAVFDPVADYFDARGLLYVGYSLLFIVFGALGGLGLLAFLLVDRKLRPEIRVPRFVFAFTVVPLFPLLQPVLESWLFRYHPGTSHSVHDAGQIVSAILILAFALLYALLVSVALRWPQRTTTVAFWFCAGMGVIGTAAMILSLFLHRR
jgi:MFS family permease